VSVPSSELGHLHPLPRKRVCFPPWSQRWEEQHSLAGEGFGGTRFGRLERKPGTLYTLWCTLSSHVSVVCVVEACCCILTRIALSYLSVCVVAPVAVVVEGIAHIVVARTVVVVPKQ
jgi:hypothetical protein